MRSGIVSSDSSVLLGPSFPAPADTDFSLTTERLSQAAHSFDAHANSLAVIEAVSKRIRPHDDLLYEAAAALQRMSSREETAEEWAARLAQTFFNESI